MNVFAYSSDQKLACCEKYYNTGHLLDIGTYWWTMESETMMQSPGRGPFGTKLILEFTDL